MLTKMTPDVNQRDYYGPNCPGYAEFPCFLVPLLSKARCEPRSNKDENRAQT
jgi:hypothetical protein